MLTHTSQAREEDDKQFRVSFARGVQYGSIEVDDEDGISMETEENDHTWSL